MNMNSIDLYEVLKKIPDVSNAQARTAANSVAYVPNVVTKIDLINLEKKWDIKSLQDDVKNMKEDIRNMKEDIRNMKEDIRNMKGDIKNLQDDVKNMKEDIKNMKEDIKHIGKELVVLDKRFGGLEARLMWRLLSGMAILQTIAVTFLQLN